MPLPVLNESSAIQSGHPEWVGKRYVTYSSVAEAIISDVPDIPLPDGMSVEAIQAALGFAPLFATLPILKVDVTSRNGNTYARSSVEGLVSQINQNHNEGLWGHLGFFEGSSRTPPAIRWVAATLDESTGIAYGKALIIDEAAIRHFKVAGATNSKVGVSLFGIDAIEDANGAIIYFNLATVDLVNAQLVGVGIAAAEPKLTTESINLTEEHMDPKEELKKDEGQGGGPAATPATVIQEIAGIAGLKEEIRGLRQVESAFLAITEIFGIAGKKPEEVAESLKESYAELEDLRKENSELLEFTISTAVEEKIKMASARPLIVEMVKSKNPVTRSQVSTALTEVMSRSAVKSFLKEQVTVTAGGNLELPGRHEVGGESWKQFLDLPEEGK